jgi:ketosteroid isomerase-like protein
MKKRVLPAIFLMIFVLCGLCAGVAAQNLREPYQEKLLNGLKVLVWNDPSSDKVIVKLRIHSGAAFDPKDKMGVMALLSDIIFPDPQTFSYFEEDLNGKLDIHCSYDYIQITATGKADEFVNILDTIRGGVVTTPIDQANFVKVRDARLAKAKEEAAQAGTIADRAAAKRLLGDFPYGRAEHGTPESLARIDRFDLVTAKEKFLDADNATLTITGKIDPKFAVKAAKQLLGSWAKSEGLVPSTFAQPVEPDARIQLIDQPGAATAEVRFALRGLASGDSENPAVVFWTGAAEKKLTESLPAECNTATISSDPTKITRDDLRRPVYVSHAAHTLPGILMIKTSFPVENVGKCFTAFKTAVDKLGTEKINAPDYSDAQKRILQIVGAAALNSDGLSDLWLNADTFKWGKVSDQWKLMNAATPADGDKIATRLFWKAPVATVIVGDAAKIKSQFDGSAQFSLTPDQEDQIKKEVTDVLGSWKSSIEKRDIDAVMRSYAPKLEVFYTLKDKDQSVVRDEFTKGFGRFDSMKLDLLKMTVQPDSETGAHAMFDKKWNFRGQTGTSVGAVQQFMRLVKTGGQWQIVEEKDLLVYYQDNKAITQPAQPATQPAKPR